MTSQEITTFLEFIRRREAEHGFANAFRWKAYVNSQGEYVAAEYTRRGDKERTSSAAERKRKSRAKKKLVPLDAIEEALEDPFVGLLRMPRERPGGMESVIDPVLFGAAAAAIPAATAAAAAQDIRAAQDVPAADTVAAAAQDIQAAQDVPAAETVAGGGDVLLADVQVPPDYTLVGEELAQRMRDHGLPIPSPVNGPNDGLPRYLVLTVDIDSLHQEEQLLIPDTSHNEKRKRHRPKNNSPQRQKKQRKVDLVLAEAVKFTGDRSLSRRNGRAAAAAAEGIVTRTSTRSRRILSSRI